MSPSIQTDAHWDLGYNSDARYVKSRLEKLWQQLSTKQAIPEKDLRPLISNSWERCLHLQIDPHTKFHDLPFLTDEQLDQHLHLHREYIKAIDPVIACVAHVIEMSNYVISFVDQEGFVLAIYGSQKAKKLVEEVNFRVGTNWNERFVGTTAVGITLATGQACHVFHEEHYCERFHHFTCTAIPIHDPYSTELIGVLDFVGYLEDHEPYVMGMAMQMARCIELEVYKSRREQDEFFRECSSQLSLGQMQRGVVILDDNNRVRRANLKAMEYLNLKTDRILSKRFSDLSAFSQWKDLNKPLFVSLPTGSKIRIERKPLINDMKTIGSLIIMEPVERCSVRPMDPHTNKPWAPIGKSTSFLKVLRYAENASQFDSNVLITGDTGTGKEVLARHIHEKSHRRNKPFIAINCGSIPRELLGSELFGYEAGAFTGAKNQGHKSKFELANGGTLMLDEIAEMPLDSQVYLLRVIEERVVTPLGSSKRIPVDIRIIAAYNKDINMEVEAGRFRKDLLFRLKVIHIELPSLRERKDDIPLLIDHFMSMLSENLAKKISRITNEALAALIAYDWPGNIRELRNVIERAIVMCPGDSITWESLPEHVRKMPGLSEDPQGRDRNRYIKFITVYNESQGNISRVAKILNISRPTVYAWKKKFGLN